MGLRCHVYITETWEGEPEESEEMKPKWFALHEIPYNDMWDDDRIWLPQLLEGKTIKGTFHFDENDLLIEHNIEEAQF